METLARIIDLSLERLNNAEYANHMTRFLALIPVKQEDRPEIESVDLTGPAALGFTDEQMKQLYWPKRISSAMSWSFILPRQSGK